MDAVHAMPRTLADDIMLLARGARALHIFKHAFELTMTHLLDLGGKLAPHKSRVFSTVASYRT
eukprot:4913050-Karenia_brevis.AAC.1